MLYIDFGAYGKLYLTVLHFGAAFPASTSSTYSTQYVVDDFGNPLFPDGVHSPLNNALQLGTAKFLTNGQTITDVTGNITLGRDSTGGMVLTVYSGQSSVRERASKSTSATAAQLFFLIQDINGNFDIVGYSGARYGTTVQGITMPSESYMGTCELNAVVLSALRNYYFAAYQTSLQAALFEDSGPDDPYSPGGTTGPGGGDGTFDFTSTDIPIPALPSIGAYNTGFISLYRPSATELHSLASYMWSSAFDINNFIKIFADPGDCILGLHIIPTSGTHPEGASAALMVGNISTGLSMTRLKEQYYECDCGTITISPKWGAYLDYSPYSKLSLYLPYIGFVPISPDDCMGGTIRVVYHVDALSGSCCAYVYCTSNRGADGHTLYTFTGSCACVCPVTEGQYTNGIIGSVRGGVELAAGLLTGNILGGLEDAANALISMAKPDVSRSGSFGGSAGLMGIQYPYLVLTVPKMATPEEQNKYIGYPSFITTELSEVTGYASIKVTHLEGMSATDEEITELLGLLEEGVIL